MRIKYDHPQAQTAVIFFNGTDITALAVEANSDEGWVDVVLIGQGGIPYLDIVGNPLVVRLNGRVIIGQRKRYRNQLTGGLSPTAYVWLLDLTMPHFSDN